MVQAQNGEVGQDLPPVGLLLLRYRNGITLGPTIRLQNLLAQTQRLRRDLHKFIVGNKFNRLLKVQEARRR